MLEWETLDRKMLEWETLDVRLEDVRL